MHLRMSTTDAPKWVTLAPDESVIWGGRPSPYLVKYWIGVATLVLLAGIVALVWILPSNWGWIGWLAIAGGLVVAAYAYVAFLSVYYVITTDKVYKKTGLLSTEVQTVRLDRIQNAMYSQSLLQRPIGCGDLTIVTAGEGTEGLVFRSVSHPSRVNGLLTDQLGTPSSRATGM